MKRFALTLVLTIGLMSIHALHAQSNCKPSKVEYHQTAVTKYIDVDGTRYAYRILGKKSGIPLVFLHGSFWNMDDWDPAVTNGLAQYYKVILFDNKGVGSTNGKTPDNIQDMAKDAVSFIKAMGYDKVNLLGLSMGGFISQQILLTEPQLVNKFILAGTGPKGSEGLSELPNTLTKVSKLTPEEQAYYLLFGHSASGRELGKQSLTRMQKRTVNRDKSLVNETFGAQMTAVLGWAKANPDALEQLKTITQPGLIVDGRYDILVPITNSFALYQNIPYTKLSLYPDTGHGSIFQYPDLFLNDAIPFLKANADVNNSGSVAIH